MSSITAESGDMRNFIFGYARVSTEQQSLDRQLDMLEKYGVDKIYNEKMTGTKRSRPKQLHSSADHLAVGSGSAAFATSGASGSQILKAAISPDRIRS